jgi:hypothetical protein
MGICFRKLKADEIDIRVAQISKNGNLMLLLFKDARVDQRLLDETFGIFGWQREHQLIGNNLYCTVSVRNPETGEWVKKQDVGTESYTEKEKGQASDSFKRACFNLGIGRELYTAPTIWVSKGNYNDNGGKTYDRFSVKTIDYDENGNISKLEIVNTNLNRVVYVFGTNTKVEKPKQEEKKENSAKVQKETPEEEKLNEEMRNSVDPVYLPTKDNKPSKEQMDKLHSEMERTGVAESVLTQMYQVKSIEQMDSAMVVSALNKFKVTGDKK